MSLWLHSTLMISFKCNVNNMAWQRVQYSSFHLTERFTDSLWLLRNRENFETKCCFIMLNFWIVSNLHTLPVLGYDTFFSFLSIMSFLYLHTAPVLTCTYALYSAIAHSGRLQFVHFAFFLLRTKFDASYVCTFVFDAFSSFGVCKRDLTGYTKKRVSSIVSLKVHMIQKIISWMVIFFGSHDKSQQKKIKKSILNRQGFITTTSRKYI